ncbi:MAG: radical SAM protein [Chloroflexota bacterium]|nr:radical SAM protein [Chloroflexota bacterium]
MRSSILQTALTDGRIRCEVCRWRCELAPGETGCCRVRSHRDGAIMADADSLVGAATIGPIEDHRLWHFFPDAQALGVGSFGTPLVPDIGLSSAHPYVVPTPGARELAAERVVQFAEQRLCRGVVWTYNDPAVTFEWVLDGVKLGRAASRFTTITTSGYFAPAAFALLAPYLDGMRLDVYGFSDRAYQTLTGYRDWRAIFKLAAEARQRWNIHMELVLHLAAGINDSDTEVAALGKWMRVALGALTPLHILPTTAEADQVQRAITAAKAAGVSYVFGPGNNQPTRCPQCTWAVVERGDGPTQVHGVVDDACENCGTALGLRLSLFRRNVRYDAAA